MEIGNALLDFGALGLFCAFLVYQHITMQKRLERISQDFLSSLEKVEASHAAAEDQIRERYDKILKRYEENRETVFEKLVKTLETNREILVALSGKIEDMRRSSLNLFPNGGPS
jgi:phosphoenolpyruvate carboxylase